MKGYENAITNLEKKIYNGQHPTGPGGSYAMKLPVMDAIREVIGKAAKETDKRWLLRLSPEAREAVKKMTFPLLGTAGVAVPMTARLRQTSTERTPS